MADFRTVLHVAPVLGSEASYSEWFMYIHAYSKLKNWDAMLTDVNATPR